MNKLTIPAILVATVMVAGIFAFMPVEQASTVHTTAAGQGFKTATVGTADFDAGDIVTLTCTLQTLVYEITVDVTGSLAADNDYDINVDLDGLAGILATDADFIATVHAGIPADLAFILTDEFISAAAPPISYPLVLQANGIIQFEDAVSDEAADGNDEDLQWTITYQSPGTCS